MQVTPLRRLDDLREHVLLHDRTVDEWADYLRSCAPTLDLNLRSGIVFSETALCLDAAARGQGVAIGDDFLAARHLLEGRLVRPFDSSVPSNNAYYWVVPEGVTSHPSVQAFRTWLMSSVRSAS
jgi:LysR family glycine cleavage system transcriptional activator